MLTQTERLQEVQQRGQVLHQGCHAPDREVLQPPQGLLHGSCNCNYVGRCCNCQGEGVSGKPLLQTGQSTPVEAICLWIRLPSGGQVLAGLVISSSTSYSNSMIYYFTLKGSVTRC